MKKTAYFLMFSLSLISWACTNTNAPTAAKATETTDEVQSGGIKMIPIETPVGKFKVWTKKFGDNPRIKYGVF